MIQAEKRNRDFVCYCFGYTVEDIRNDFLKNGRSLIMEQIMDEKKIGGCNCAAENPQGRWCIGDVRQVVNKIQKIRGSKSITDASLPVGSKNMSSRNICQ